MPLEEDEIFRNRPPKTPRGKHAHERVPYHQMTDEERRAAWAELRAAQRSRARRGRLAPLLWIGASVASFVTGAVLVDAGYGIGRLFNWVGVALVAFALVSLGRGLLGRSSGRKDDFAPPGF